MRLNFQAAFWPYLLLTITPLFWAGNFVTARALHEQIAPISLSYARWALVLLLIAPWALLRLWRARAELLGAFWIVLALAVLGVANFNTFIYTGLQTTSAQNALLLLAPLPLYIALVEWLLEGKLMRRTQALGLSLALVGMLVIVSAGQPAELLNLEFQPWRFVGAGGAGILVAVFGAAEKAASASQRLYLVRRHRGARGYLLDAFLLVGARAGGWAAAAFGQLAAGDNLHGSVRVDPGLFVLERRRRPRRCPARQLFYLFAAVVWLAARSAVPGRAPGRLSLNQRADHSLRHRAR